MSIHSDEFAPILKELQRKSLEINKYRVKSGNGRSQTFGMVNRRCLPPDYSRQCWKRPLLYKLLLDFAAKHVTIPWNSITLNQNYCAQPHRDKGNTGLSYLVAFGSYTGGKLKMHEGLLAGSHDICGNAIVANFSDTTHSVEPFEGERYSLVFYTLDLFKRFKYCDVPPPSVKEVDGKWIFYRGDEAITDGLPHPLKGKIVKITEPIEISFE